MGDDDLRDTGDLLAEHEANGGDDPGPAEPVTDPDHPDYVEPYQAATPVQTADEEADQDEDG